MSHFASRLARSTLATVGRSTRYAQPAMAKSAWAARPSVSRVAVVQSHIATRFASTESSPPSAEDPTELNAMEAMNEGNLLIEDGKIEEARNAYAKSVEIMPTASACFNLGVAEYHMKNVAAAIEAWKQVLDLQPASPDSHMNLASAYILSEPPQPALAIKHLKEALELAPEDPEIIYNLAAVLESTGSLQSALKMYERAVKFGVERAEQNVRNVSAKLLAQDSGSNK